MQPLLLILPTHHPVRRRVLDATTTFRDSIFPGCRASVHCVGELCVPIAPSGSPRGPALQEVPSAESCGPTRTLYGMTRPINASFCSVNRLDVRKLSAIFGTTNGSAIHISCFYDLSGSTDLIHSMNSASGLGAESLSPLLHFLGEHWSLVPQQRPLVRRPLRNACQSDADKVELRLPVEAVPLLPRSLVDIRSQRCVHQLPSGTRRKYGRTAPIATPTARASPWQKFTVPWGALIRRKPILGFDVFTPMCRDLFNNHSGQEDAERYQTFRPWSPSARTAQSRGLRHILIAIVVVRPQERSR
jgi:hypothetical protein